MDVRLLDGFAVHEDGRELDLGGRKPRALLALLAASSPSPVAVDRCIQAIWGEDASPGAKRSLQTYVSSLRAAIDPHRLGRLEGTDDGYRLILVDGDSRDLDAFRALAAPDGDPTRTLQDCAEQLGAALQLWGAVPLGDLAYDQWAQPLLQEWTAERLQAAEAWADALTAAGQPGAAVLGLEPILADQPFHEGLMGRLMTALYQAGRQSEALERYRRFADQLGEELGLEPSPELQDLEERILLHDPSLTPRRPTPTNLPPTPTEIVGRQAELESLGRLMETTRLLTITGAGGSGKTTTALALARSRLPDHPDGVWWFRLADLSDSAVVGNEMLGAMRLPAPVGAAPTETLVRWLLARRCLLVFDNCEHLAEGISDIVATVLRSCPDVSVLTTSREQLSVSGEVTWRLPPLGLPTGTDRASVLASEAGRLFSLRSTQANPAFAVTDETAPPIASICRRLDGLPLAIELAAARLATMGLGELEGRLDDRFAVLVLRGDRSSQHHRTLRETVEWSHDLLTEDEQRLYRMVSVFRGGFDAGSVESLTGDPDSVRVLDSLVSQSLVTVDHSARTSRYALLETIRQHGQEFLERHAELEETQRAHLRWMAELVGEGARHLEGPDQQTWIARFRREADNIRAALAFAEERDPVTGASMAAGLARFWWTHAMERDPRTLDDSTSFLEEGHAWASRLLLAAGDRLPLKIRARLLTALGGLLEIRLGLTEAAIAHLDEATAAWAEIGDARNQGWATFYRGCAAWGTVPMTDTHATFGQACDLHEQAGDPFGLGFAKLMRGFAAALSGAFDAAAADFESFTELAEKVRNPNMLAHADDAVACLAVIAGHPTAEDRERVPRTIQRFRRISNYACLAHGIHTAAAWLAAEGHLEEAARTLGVVQAIRDRLTMVIPSYEDRTSIVEDVGLSSLDGSVRKAAFELGNAMEPEEGIEWVLAAFAGRVSE